MNRKDHRVVKFGIFSPRTVHRAREGHHSTVANEYGNEHKDDCACVELWCMVVERAVLDLCVLRRLAGRNDLKKYEYQKLRSIEKYHPVEFIEGPWFEEICDYLHIDPDKVRRGIDMLVESMS